MIPYWLESYRFLLDFCIISAAAKSRPAVVTRMARQYTAGCVGCCVSHGLLAVGHLLMALQNLTNLSYEQNIQHQ
jgi:hypothetical protein